MYMVDVSAILDVSNMCLLISFQLVCAPQSWRARNADQAIKSYSLTICLQSRYIKKYQNNSSNAAA